MTSSARALDTDGDLAIPFATVTGNDAVAQRLRVRLSLVAGEWFADERVGVPYMRDILGVKNPDLAAVKALLDRVVRECPGIARTEGLTVSLDKASRVLTVDFEAVADDGTRLPIHREIPIYG